MCGITGFFTKGGDTSESVGRILVDMCQALYRRGPDSTGFALYGEPEPDTHYVRVFIEDGSDGLDPAVVEAASQLVGVRESRTSGRDVRLITDSDADGRLADWIEEKVPGARVFSIGQSMEIVKDLGSAQDVDSLYDVSGFQGTHGIGHTRMATESRVDVAHSHPFWARPFEDIAVVHNGTITNYHKLRRRLSLKGHHFSTGNDSEVIAVYLADRMEDGESLDDALRASVHDLDGTFAYLISTRNGIGLARDQFATKPLLYAEDDELVVLATEEIAIRQVLHDQSLRPRELQAKEVRWWER